MKFVNEYLYYVILYNDFSSARFGFLNILHIKVPKLFLNFLSYHVLCWIGDLLTDI